MGSLPEKTVRRDINGVQIKKEGSGISDVPNPYAASGYFCQDKMMEKT